MGYLETHQPNAATEVRRAQSRRLLAPAELWPCLIVSPSEERSEHFRQAVAEGGWDPLVRCGAEAAREALSRWRFRLAFVDLQGDGDRVPPGFRELAELLANDRELLLVICGTDGHPLEEIWAHQLGTWLYLPGASDEGGLVMLCSEARTVAERLYKKPLPTLVVGGRKNRGSLATDT